MRTHWWRCRSNARRSRSSGEGIQIAGNRSSASSCSNSAASRRSCFCRRVSALRIVAGWPTRHVIRNSSINRRNQPIDPVASIPTTTGARQAPHKTPGPPRLRASTSARLTSPVSRSSIAIVCWLACKSHPIIRISASFNPSAVSMDTHSLLRPSRGRRRYDINTGPIDVPGFRGGLYRRRCADGRQNFCCRVAGVVRGKPRRQQDERTRCREPMELLRRPSASHAIQLRAHDHDGRAGGDEQDKRIRHI